MINVFSVCYSQKQRYFCEYIFKMKSISEKVNGFKSRHKEGFVQSEIEVLLKDYPQINMNMFNSALEGNTCALIDGEVVKYRSDIVKALQCGLEGRNLRSWELD